MPINTTSGSIGNTPGSQIDTGTGGFSIDGIAHTYDTGTDGINRTVWSSGQVNVDKTKRDLSKDTKVTLASYLSKTTLGGTNSSPSPVRNAFPIEHNSGDPPVNIDLMDEKGFPQKLSNTPYSQPHFADLNSGRSLNSTALNVLRGREAPTISTKVDGNTLLSGAMDQIQGIPVPPDPGSINSGKLNNNSPVKDYTEKSLTEEAYNNKRFVSEEKSLPLRASDKIESTPYNGLTPQDIPSDKKVSLADYLGKSTERNSYPIDKLSVEEKLIDSNGNPVSPHATLNSNSYAPFNSLPTYAVGAYGLKKGKETSTATVDGNTLLKDLPLERDIHKDKPIKKITLGTPVSDFYSATMLSNRFTSDKSYEDNSGTNSKQFAKKYPLGQSLSPDDPRRELTFGRLAQIGNVLSLRASQELNSLHDEFNPTDGSAATGALLPGKAQLGVEKISAAELTAESVIAHLTKDGVGEELFSNPAGESWGSLNNIQDEFSGISAFGMQLLAIALMVALSIIMLAMSALFLIPAGGDTSRTTDDIGRRTFGSYTEDKFSQDKSVAGIVSAMLTGNFNFWRMVGVEGTAHPLEKCLPVGALAFFGIDSSNVSFGTMATEIAKGAVSVTESPGYYSIIARNVSRSYLQIGEAFSSIGKAFSSGMTSGVKQLLSIIEIFRSSKFIRILNVFAHLGDQILLEQAKADEASRGSGIRYLSRIDEADNNAAGKSRLTYNNENKKLNVDPLTLSWASYRARDALILPKNIKTFLVSNLEGKPVTNTIIGENEKDSLGGVKGPLFRQDDSRISTHDRETIENQLNAEYVPFYMHDVRTNEIISFHAFLASLSDDYTANYDSAEGIGRIETIKTYKSTNRKIGFSFYIAATNQYDFDHMWLKINKLTTMVYPQFTEGRRISLNTDNNIIMPFSQVIQAPPLVRIRIGDLIQSNYSKFNLARLFGLDSLKSELNGHKVEYSEADLISKRQKILGEMKSINGKTFILSNGSKLDIPVYESSEETSLSQSPLASPVGITLPLGLALKVTNKKTEDSSVCEVIYEPQDDSCAEADRTSIFKKYGGINSGGSASTAIIGKKYSISHYQMIPTNLTKASIDSQIKENTNNNDSGKYYNEVNDFMNEKDPEKGNAIVKSFRSSGGRGLAGFIDSMNFDWYDKVTWEIDEDRVAPKMCKVTISFSPIHDITPGLDSNGFNRAPIYPVAGLTEKQSNKNYNVINEGNK